MNILILTNHLKDFGGSEIQALEIYDYFKQQHSVKIYANYTGQPIIDLFRPEDVIADIDDINLNQFDLVWSQHAVFARLFKDKTYPDLKLKLISVHLSPFELLELSALPYMVQLNPTFIANSEETKAKLLEFTVPEASIIVSGNPAPDIFRHPRPTPIALQKILIVSNHAPEEIRQAAELLRRHNLTVDFLGIGSDNKQRVTPKILAGYDVVVSIGKTVQYALLGNIPVYNYDHFGGCGYLDADNFEKARQLNFSGRGFDKKTAEEIAHEILAEFKQGLDFVSNLTLPDDWLLSNFMQKVLTHTQPIIFSSEYGRLLKLSSPIEERFSSYYTDLTNTVNHVKNLDAIINDQKKQISQFQKENDFMKQQNYEKTIADLEAKIEELNTLLHQERNAVHDKQTHITNLEHILAEAQASLEKLSRYNSLYSYKAVKPLLSVERGISSANRYRNAFRHLVNEKGSIGKAYQFLRHMYLDHGFHTVKQFLKGRNVFPNGMGMMAVGNTFDIGNIEAYQKWIKINDTPSEKDIAAMLAETKTFQHTPKISVLMPVYNVDVKWLAMAIDSVRGQLYENWELCIADDASPNTAIRPMLEHYAAMDERIKVVFREQNGHISENSNSALELASGEWLALMDHDDLLPENALFEVVKVLQSKPDTVLIYSDEDKVDEKGVRFMPHFKSDFNLDLLYGQNYISHLGVYRTEIAKEIGGFRKGLEGSQDYDFLLRYLLKIDHSKVVHIPKILYHWRAIEGSTALASGEKSYTTEAGIKALQHHFALKGSDVTVTRGKADNLYRVQWHWQNQPLVSLIIPTRNGYAITKQAIDSILNKTTYQNYEILLVDNNSDDPQALAYFEEIARHPKVRLLRYPHPFNYSAINNFAVEHAQGEIIGLINNDIEVINGEWLEEMTTQAQRPDIGCVGAMLYYPNDTIQHAGVFVGINGVAAHSHKHYIKKHPGYFSRLYVTQNLIAVTAACLLVRKDVFNEVNGLNEQDLTVAFNDVDFCLKVHTAGYRNLWTPFAQLYHHESISRGHEDNPEKQARFKREIDYMINTWKTNTLQDPYYNPNLTLEHENFSIAMTSRVKD